MDRHTINQNYRRVGRFAPGLRLLFSLAVGIGLVWLSSAVLFAQAAFETPDNITAAIPDLTITDASLVEGNLGAQSMVFTATLSSAYTATVSADFATLDGSASVIAGDYLPISGTLSFTPGLTTLPISVTIQADTQYELDEIFTLNLSNPVDANITDSQGVGTIINDDLPPGLSISDAAVLEGNSGLTSLAFTVTVSAPISQTITADFATADGSAATLDSDYLPITGTLTISPGLASHSITVTLNGDAKYESDETFTVSLSNSAHASLGDNLAVGTILNDDAPPAITIGDGLITEGNTGSTSLLFTVSLSAPISQTASVDFASADGSATLADNDYLASSGSLLFAAGEITRTLAVTILGDTRYELNETFAISLTNAVSSTISDSQATGTILNDDSAPVLTIEDVAAVEGDSGTTDFIFTVSLTPAISQTANVDFATSDGSATLANSDYTSTSGTLTFLPGQTSQPVTVTVQADARYELDETFTVDLSNPTNSLFGDSQALGTIQNDDPAPTLSVANIAVAEGNSGLTDFVFTVSLSPAISQTASVDFATSDGSATLADSDYISASGNLTFLPGQTSQPVTVTVQADTHFELSETFTLDLSNPTHATLGSSQASATISNDDTQPEIAAINIGATEGNSGFQDLVFNLSLSNRSFQAVSIDYALSDGSATVSDNDYTPITGTLNIPAGALTQPITISITGDATYEADETFLLNLSNPVNGSNTDNQAVGTILNDDPLPALSVDDVSAQEGDTGSQVYTFTLSLSNPSAQLITIDYAANDSSATIADNDYLISQGTAAFTAGSVTQTITVTVMGDMYIEPDETFLVDLSNASNASIAKAQGTGSILNDDIPPQASIGDGTIIEGDAGTTSLIFQVTLSRPILQTAAMLYASQDNTALLSDNDYIQAVGVVSFLPGEIMQPITVTVSGDVKFELAETLKLVLSSPILATIADSVATGTIQNDDPIPSMPSNLFGVEMNPLAVSGGLAWITPTQTTWVSGVEIAWADVEPTPGARNWSALTTAVAELQTAAANNLTPIVRVGGAPEWAQKYQSPGFTFKTCGPIDTTYLANFTIFMQELVLYLNTHNIHVQYWEFWDEPDTAYASAPAISASPTSGCWGEPTDPFYGGGHYALMLKSVYSSLVTLDPSAQILVGGLQLECDPANPPAGKTCESASFIDGILAEETQNGPLMHGISFHAVDTFTGQAGQFENSDWLTSWNSSGTVLLAKSAFLRSRLSAASVSEKYLLSTGSTLVDPTCAAQPPYNCPKVTPLLETTKAGYVAQNYAAALVKGLAADVWSDVTGTSQRNNGLVTQANPPGALPGQAAYAFASQILQGAAYISDVINYPGVAGYEFDSSQPGEHIWLIWSRDGAAHTFYLPAVPLQVYAVDGTPQAASQAITVTVDPLYLIMPASVPRSHLPVFMQMYRFTGVANGSFEFGLQGWTTIEQPFPAVTVTASAPGQPDPFIPLGERSMLLGDPTLTGIANCNTLTPNTFAAIEQTFDMPGAGAGQSILLQFKYIIYSQDSNAQFDAFELFINNASTPVFADANNFQNAQCAWNRVPSVQNPRIGLTTGWAVKSIDLTAYAGQTITIRFRNINRPDNYYNTYTYLDDVQIVVQ